MNGFKPFFYSSRRAFVLFWVSLLIIICLILALALDSYRSASARQLRFNVEQNRMTVLAQSAINETLSQVKLTINDKNSQYFKAIKKLIRDKPKLSEQGNKTLVFFSSQLGAESLELTKSLVAEIPVEKINIATRVELAVYRRTGLPERPSYLGFVEISALVGSANRPTKVNLRERRDIKIVDLSDPFMDKYVLFLKNFTPALNHPEKRIILEGINPSTNEGRFSFAYLGNRNYPASPQYPKGSESIPSPPIRLDLDFKQDYRLLGSSYQPDTYMPLKKPEYSKATRGSFFYVKSNLNYTDFSKSFSIETDYHVLPELLEFYLRMVELARPYQQEETSIAYLIMKDYQKAGGNPSKSEVFQSIIRTLEKKWKYFFGYTDFLNVSGDHLNLHPFSGISSYFEDVKTENPISATGGKMPLLFGEGRNIPVFIEGPAYLRFFKIALLDEIEVPVTIGDEEIKLNFPTIPLPFESTPKSCSGKKLVSPIDPMNKNLMSRPVIHLPINNFFFPGINYKPSNKLFSGIDASSVFPFFDSELFTITQVYRTTQEFLDNHLRISGNQKILELDGNILILGPDQQKLELVNVTSFTGRGRLILASGNCLLGSIKPSNSNYDRLYIFLMSGDFVLGGTTPVVEIHAALHALSANGDGGIRFAGKNLILHGNLAVDHINNLQDLPNQGFLKIIHDPKLYHDDFSIYTSIGSTRELNVAKFFER